MKNRILATLITTLAVGLAQRGAAVDFHVTTAQELQNALTLAAANGADDNIYLAAGYYTGNFNFNSAENRNLLVQGEPGTTNTAITIDGAATGRDMNLANSGTGNFTVRGLTFLRNCGTPGIGSLRIAGGTGSTLLVDTCRFLSPTNGIGTGLEIASGQNATVTNCVVVGNGTTVNNGWGGGGGVMIAGVPGTISVGGCILSTNSSPQNYGGLSITGGETAIFVNNTMMANGSSGCEISGITGSITFLNNIAVDNYYGASVSGSSLVVAGNVFRNNGYGFVGGVGVGGYAGVGPLVFSNNVVAYNRSIGGTFTGGVGAGSLAIVAGNTFAGNLHGGLDWHVGSANNIVTGNTFTGNMGESALSCKRSVTISNNVFSGNSAPKGGALFSDSACIVTANTFNGNTATSGYGGGAHFSFDSGTNVVAGNLFRQNSATLAGGIFVSGPNITLTDNLVVKSLQGGGIYVSTSARLTMINNTVSDNTTAGNGGGLACSISGTSEILDVYNNIIWGNSASGNGADVWLAGTGSKKTFLNNDVHGMYGVWDIAANLLDVAPAFFDPVNGDYHLRSTSACINAGTNGAPSIPALDLDGNARTNAGIVDLGAYEFNNSLRHPADTDQNWVISAAEYAAYAAAWKNSQSWPSGPSQIPADYVTRAGYLQNQGGSYHNDGAGAPLGWKPGL